MTARSFLLAFVLGLSVVFLSSCVGGPPLDQAPDEGSSPEVQESDTPPLETASVTYTGVLAKGGVTFYQQGTHHLSLDDGSFILLESDSIPLPLYEGKRARVIGSIRPTVEAGGLIMDVAEVTVVDERGTVLGGGQFCGGVAGIPCPSGYECILETDDVDAAGVCREVVAKEDSEEAEESEESEESEEKTEAESQPKPEPDSAKLAEQNEPEPEPPSAPEETAGGKPEPPLQPDADHIALIAEDDISPGRWTQQYESPQVGLRVSMHKNSYWQNFGARPDENSFLHLEIGHRPVANLGDGPIALDLKGGTLSSLGIAEGGAVERDGIVAVHKTFDESRYIVIQGNKRLRDYIEYMLSTVEKIGGE